MGQFKNIPDSLRDFVIPSHAETRSLYVMSYYKGQKYSILDERPFSHNLHEDFEKQKHYVFMKCDPMTTVANKKDQAIASENDCTIAATGFREGGIVTYR